MGQPYRIFLALSMILFAPTALLSQTACDKSQAQEADPGQLSQPRPDSAKSLPTPLQPALWMGKHIPHSDRLPACPDEGWEQNRKPQGPYRFLHCKRFDKLRPDLPSPINLVLGFRDGEVIWIKLGLRSEEPRKLASTILNGCQTSAAPRTTDPREPARPDDPKATTGQGKEDKSKGGEGANEPDSLRCGAVLARAVDVPGGLQIDFMAEPGLKAKIEAAGKPSL